MENNKNIDDTFLARWLNNELTEQELIEFENSEDYSIYKKVIDKTDNWENQQWTKDQVWDRIERKTRKSKTVYSRIVGIGIVSLAASILLILGFFHFVHHNDGEMHIQTLAKENRQFTLPDGSLVALNASSTLSYNRDNFTKNRILELEGEAYFEVKKGSDFIVSVNNVEVSVLGTSFNIRDRRNVVEVSCFTGKVSVEISDNNKVEVLDNGDRVLAFDNNFINIERGALSDIKPSWTKGQVKFENVDFVEVVEELERQFDLEIVLPENLKNLKAYTGGFDTDDQAKALRLIATSVSCDYETQDSKVYFRCE